MWSHKIIAGTVDYSSYVTMYERHTPEKKVKYAEIAGVVASWLVHHDQYGKQYYSECYNRVVQVHNKIC